MATLVGEIRDQEENALSFKPGGSHIQIDSISIEISSGEINGAVEECKHFSIRGFVSEQRKKDIGLCSPFISDGDCDNSNISSLELPPLDVHKFKWWRCSGCLQDCNSSQGTSKDIATKKRIISQNLCLQETGTSKGLSKLFAKAGGNGFTTNGSFICQRSSKGKQVQEGGIWHDDVREPLTRCGNSLSKLPLKIANKRKHLLQDDDCLQEPLKENNVSGSSNSRGASFLKPISEAVVVPFNGLDFDKPCPPRKSDKARGMSKVVMGPPNGLANDDKTKEKNLQKPAASSSQGTSTEISMPPPGGFPNTKQSSHKSGRGSRLRHHSPSRGPSKDLRMLPISSYGSGKSISASKQQLSKHKVRIWQKGETSTAGTLHKKKNYAKRSVQQADSAGDQLEIHKADEKGIASNPNGEVLQLDLAKEGDVQVPERCNFDQVTLQLDRKKEVGSSDKFIEKVSNYSTAGRAPDRGQIGLPECNQFAEADVNGDFYPRKDGTDKKFISVRPLVDSNRLFKRPRIEFELEAGRNNMYEEEEEEDYRGMHLRRMPKIRLLSDVIAKYPTNVGEQSDNSKAYPGASADISPGRGLSAKSSEQSSKRKASPIASYDTSAERGMSDKAGEQPTKSKASPVVSLDYSAGRGVSVSGSWKKKKSVQDCEEHLAYTSSGGTKRSSIRSAEPENRTVPTPRSRPGVDLSPQVTFFTDTKRQGRYAFDTTEVEKKPKKTRAQYAGPSSVPSRPRHVSRGNCEMPSPSDRCSFGESAVSTSVYGGQVTDGATHKSNKNIFCPEKEERIQGFGKKKKIPRIGKDYQPATKFLQFEPDNVENAPGEDTSDYIIIGSGFHRSDAVENCDTVTDYLRTSVSNANELWISQVQAGGTLLECKGGEGSSGTQQKGIKGRVKDIDINSIPVDDKTSEPGTADDIPMDIVELLAKHQHERRCDSNKEELSVLELNAENTARKSYPYMLKPQASYASQGVGRQFEPVTGSPKQNLSDNLFDQSRKGVLVGYPNDDPFCARFSGFTQSQGQVPGGAQYSSSIGSTAKSWNGNMGPFRATSRGILQPVQSFNRYQGMSSPLLNTQIWPPLMPSIGRASNQGMYSHSQGSDMLQKGKANQGTISFNIGNPNPSCTQSWTSEYGGRQKTTEFLSPQVMRRPVDLNSNEAIPAMQLLNLVQVAGSRSSSTPPVNGNTEFLRKLPFDNHQYNNKPYSPAGPHYEPYNNKPTLTISRHHHPFYDGEGRSSFIDKCCPCSSALPAPQMFAASVFQNDSAAAAAAFASGDQRTIASGTPLVRDLSFDKKRKPTSSSKNANAPMWSGNAVQQRPLRTPAIDIVHQTEVCILNRNPAEILDLKEVGSFMIGPEELRRGKPRIASNVKRPHTLKGKGRPRLHKS
ncbi:hypothetical protein V2J09_013258 [Rumex salicifolius]